MIFPADRPLEGACGSVRALYVALNSPVVRRDPLPVGPASAAVVLHAREPGVSVMIRSVRTGHVLFFTSEAESPPSPEMALDAALSFAEALGFVFDEDEVGPDGQGDREAARLWCELIGEDYPDGCAVAGFPDLPEGDLEGGWRGSEDGIRHRLIAVTGPAPVPDPSRILSKFRWPSEPAASSDPSPAERSSS